MRFLKKCSKRDERPRPQEGRCPTVCLSQKSWRFAVTVKRQLPPSCSQQLCKLQTVGKTHMYGQFRVVNLGESAAVAPPTVQNAIRYLHQVTSLWCTTAQVTTAAAVIRLTARHDRSGFVPQGRFTPLQLRSVASTEASKHWLLTSVGRDHLRSFVRSRLSSFRLRTRWSRARSKIKSTLLCGAAFSRDEELQRPISPTQVSVRRSQWRPGPESTIRLGRLAT